MLRFDEVTRRSTGAYPYGYGDKIEPPPGASAQALLLCFGGRHPSALGRLSGCHQAGPSAVAWVRSPDSARRSRSVPRGT